MDLNKPKLWFVCHDMLDASDLESTDMFISYDSDNDGAVKTGK